MGYDMSIVDGPTEAEKLATQAAREQFNAAVKDRDALLARTGHKLRWDAGSGGLSPAEGTPDDVRAAQMRVDEAMDVMRAADVTYFRLNIRGMGRCCELMTSLGMLIDGYSMRDQPPYPDQYSSEISELAHEIRDHEELPTGMTIGYGDRERPPNDLEIKLAKKYNEETDAWLRWHPDAGSGIPIHKLCSNDGWVVTPEECAAAVSMWQTARSGDRLAITIEYDWWGDWIAFLQRASERGGFRVY